MELTGAPTPEGPRPRVRTSRPAQTDSRRRGPGLRGTADAIGASETRARRIGRRGRLVAEAGLSNHGWALIQMGCVTRGAGHAPAPRQSHCHAAANLPRPNTRSRSSALALSNAVVAARTASTLAKAAFTAGRSLIFSTQAIVCGNFAFAVSPRNAGRLRDQG